MVGINFFDVENWLDDNIPRSKHDLASSCARPVSLEELKTLSNGNDPLSSPISSVPMVYGSPTGSEDLRSTIANLYSAKSASPLSSENVLITPGGSMANFLSFYSLCNAKDHVICHYPTYQQLYELPKTIGAEVSFWGGKENEKWHLDIEELKSLIKPNTKIIVLNNPQNPTGAAIPRSTLQSVVDIAKERSIIIISDEVYRPLFHSISPGDEEFPPSIMSLGYENVVAIGSMSKAYSLAGIRVGWVASRNPAFINSCFHWRSYSSIAVSQLDDKIATVALSPSCISNLLKRNTDLAKQNVAILEAFIEKHRWACDWTHPVAGTITFIKFSKMGKPVDDSVFCEQVLEKTGVLLSPGSKCFGHGKNFKGYVRLGFVIGTKELEAGLEALSKFLENEYENVPVAKDD